MSRKSVKRRKLKKMPIIIISILIILSVSALLIGNKINNEKENKLNQERLQKDIIKHYNEFVKTNKETTLYKLVDNKYLESGKVAKNQELVLKEQEITYKDEYLIVNTFIEPYYIYYKDLEIIESLSAKDNRYKNYIPFNKNIITKEITNFYDEEGDLVYALNFSVDLPIIINKGDTYGVEYNNQLLYVKNEDVSKIKDNNNTELTNTSGIAVLNYHFFYDETLASERNDCNQIICMSKSGFKKHLDYIKENNIFTPTMNEFEMYLNNQINLPRSVLITIDDGWRTSIAEELLEEYKLNGTIFLITSWFNEINFLNNHQYIEYHSHGDNLHNQGECPGGQGGAIKCKEKNALLQDLNLSRQKLGGTTAFCYPFYEYNNYSINTLKEAGFTLAFAGGFKKATPSTDKYQIPRYVMYDYTTVNQLASYIG